MTWLRFAASPPFAGFVAVCAAASIGACHLIGGAGDLTFEAGAGGSGAGSSGTAGGDAGGLPLGAECDPDANTCASGICVDDVCCNVACGGDCETCAAPGLEGTCSPDIGASCGDDNICDGAGRCATGTVDWALVGGTSRGEVPGRGALDGPNLRFVTQVQAFTLPDPETIRFGPLELPVEDNVRSIVGSIDDMEAGVLEGRGEPDGVQQLQFISAFPDGGYVVAGLATGTIDLEPAQDLVVGATARPVVIAFNPNGSPKWGKLFTTTQAAPRILALAASQAHIAIAFTDDTTGATRNRLVTLGRESASVIEDMNWDLGTTAGTGGELTGLAYDSEGGLWAAGWCRGQASIDAVMGGAQVVAPITGQVVPVLVHYDANYRIPSGGAVTMGSDTDVRLWAVAAADDTVYVAGTFAGGTLTQASIVDGTSVDLTADATGEDPFVFALDLSGKARWGRSFASTATEIQVPGLAHDGDGDVVFAGWLRFGNVAFDQTTIGSTSTFTSFITKLVPGGELAWAKSDSTTMSEPRLNWVGVDGQGRAWATGESTGDVFGQTGLGDVDMLLLRLAP